MNNNSFENIGAVIRARHTTKAIAMNGNKIPDEHIQKLLGLADWAPTHGQTEPWRFFVFRGDALKSFGKFHAELYWNETLKEKRIQPKYDKLIHSADRASHLVIAVMKRSLVTKIPALEERVAVAASIQNILLGATALGIASFWSTGGMTYHPDLKAYLQLGEEDNIIGLLYLGYTDEPDKKRKRNIPLEEKVFWM